MDSSFLVHNTLFFQHQSHKSQTPEEQRIKCAYNLASPVEVGTQDSGASSWWIHCPSAETNDGHPPVLRWSVLLLLGGRWRASILQGSPSRRHKSYRAILLPRRRSGVQKTTILFLFWKFSASQEDKQVFVSSSAHIASRRKTRSCYFPFGSVLKLLSKEKVLQRRSKRNTQRAPPPRQLEKVGGGH